MPGRNPSSYVSLYSRLLASPLFGGDWMQRALVAAYFLYKSRWEDPFRWLIREHPELFRGGDILDIGANVGYTSCLFAHAADPSAKVYSLEPDASCFRLLGKVLQWKKISGVVTPFQSAAGRDTGTVRFCHNARHSADHRVVTEKFNAGNEGREFGSVPMTTVDEFVRAQGISRLAFIKIDVQGYESEVCAGMQGTLEAFPGAVVCFEYSPCSMVEMGFSGQDLIEFFRSRSFHLYVLNRSRLEAVCDFSVFAPESIKDGYLDILATRNRIAFENAE